jgi:hypothetical protein
MTISHPDQQQPAALLQPFPPTFRRMWKSGRIPVPVWVSPRHPRWRAADIAAAVERLAGM